MNKLLWVLYILMGLAAPNVKAQDAVFSQAFMSPVYLNPASTGAGEYDLRISAIYRRQWWAIPSGIHYTAFSVDKFLPSIGSGVGFLATNSSEGYLKKTGLYGSYAKSFCAGTRSVAENGQTPAWFFNMGLQFGVAQRRINYNDLTFADQLNMDGVIPGRLSEADLPVQSGKWFPDFAAGFFFNRNYTDNSRLLVGFSAHHINRPDESLTATNDTFRSQLPVRWGLNLFYTRNNEDNRWSFSFGGMAYRQSRSNLWQAGFEATQNVFDISLGLWYKSNVNFSGMNALSVTLSLNLTGKQNKSQHVRAGVAHDAVVGGKGYSYTGGSSELALLWDINTHSAEETGDPCKPVIDSRKCPNNVY